MLENLFASISDTMQEEQFDELAAGQGVRIERIVSRGHSSPEEGWYDQPQHEWVAVLQGRAVLAFATGEERELGPGDHLVIPAHCRHRVTWSDPEQTTIWLAVHYDG
ncbi:cupin domain-containing protein [Halomonas sp. KAO]|uniref:cupin domain-containing protein n=1 Tax=unclassified Halomonas TaxID=2609666 RepID=UPI0018A07792|nr:MULTISPECIES: cupin domain-containing protein [unclassified Halomonas]MBF7052563.1 cupin domain-containing protein [Halomonas sp. KAO]MDT0500600.1 cupin domain-containing protein [Halomonas sp. PAR7]MDT0511504.1 cupin domain-containing protein [Halomonas sp. LES1]MDT0590208.1 cupin domain-containing protein [Halomonas sp. PAR8]